MSRRVSLPGADELFRATSTASAPAAEAADPPAPTVLRTRPAREASRRPSGRQRHDEKITVYVSPEELVELERSRLTLRADHGLGVDRGRIVREALAVVLADLDAKGADSILVRRLRDA
ncbi:MAG TPA: hypothetical protein VFE07_01535 [Marmoricola sp.]|nr:hypothetical protein [Marmoricola sp.]